MLCVVLDCISSVNDVFVYLIYYLFVYLWAFIQIHSYSTGFSPVARVVVMKMKMKNILYIELTIISIFNAS